MALPDTPTTTIVSRHHTSEGIVTWLRDSSGALQARIRPYGSAEEHVAAGGRTPQIELRAACDGFALVST
jgi:hypothetical protein